MQSECNIISESDGLSFEEEERKSKAEVQRQSINSNFLIPIPSEEEKEEEKTKTSVKKPLNFSTMKQKRMFDKKESSSIVGFFEQVNFANQPKLFSDKDNLQESSKAIKESQSFKKIS